MLSTFTNIINISGGRPLLNVKQPIVYMDKYEDEDRKELEKELLALGEDNERRAYKPSTVDTFESYRDLYRFATKTALFCSYVCLILVITSFFFYFTKDRGSTFITSVHGYIEEIFPYLIN